MFKNNVGPKDRVYRSVAGTILVSCYFSADHWSLKYVALFVGLYLLFTAVMAVCAIYSVVGRNTNTEAQPEVETDAGEKQPDAVKA